MSRALADEGSAERRQAAPVYRDAFRLAEWILAAFGGREEELPRSICRLSLGLCDHLALALGGRDTEGRVADADDDLVRLRSRLRLAASVGAIDEERLVHALGLCDAIGRQLGGWLRRLEVV